MTLSNGKSIELNNITESGNGYIRFSDGTQICYECGGSKINNTNITPDTCFNATLQYPKKFIEFPCVSVSHQTPNSTETIKYSHNIFIEGVASDTAGFTVEFVNKTGKVIKDTYLYISYIAIGRWK